MSMLDRYRKAGGFQQILKLLETCGPQKQEKFLELVRAEDPRWADAIKSKMLDTNRIFSWKDETLAEIFGVLQDITVSVIFINSPQVKERVEKFLTHGRRRKIEDLIGSTKPSAAEISSMNMKMIETVRQMAHDGQLRFDKVDPSLVMDDKFEENLLRPQAAVPLSSASNDTFKIEYDSPPATEPAAPVAAAASGAGDRSVAELTELRRKVADLGRENAVLRHELNVAKNKLDQIKKIA